jgi:hypothetical protein
VGKPVQREAMGIGFLLEYEQQRFAPAVLPLHQYGQIQFALAATQPFLQLLLTKRENAHVVARVGRFFAGKEGERLPRVIENQILEILIVALPVVAVCHRQCPSPVLSPVWRQVIGDGAGTS